MNTAQEIRAMLLAAGLGTRLDPLTREWPKCLMPIGERPLLEYWLETLYCAGVKTALVNTHHHSQIVKDFLNRKPFDNWVYSIYENELLGTAGTLVANMSFFKESTTLLIHADNWCQCSFTDFLLYHRLQRPRHCLITMMTFETPTPHACGIVETDTWGVVAAFYEKAQNPPGNLANGAVYLLEPEVLDWMAKNPEISDFSTQVLPNFLGRIATWHNTGIHRDIGTPSMLALAQNDLHPAPLWSKQDSWRIWFNDHSIHQQIAQLVATERLL